MNARRGQDEDALRDAELRRREEAVDDRGSRMQAMGTKLETLERKVSEIEATINRGKGALIAIVTIGGVLGWALTYVKDLFHRGH